MGDRGRGRSYLPAGILSLGTPGAVGPKWGTTAGRTVLAELMDHLPDQEFHECETPPAGTSLPGSYCPLAGMRVDELIVPGGGAHSPAIMGQLAARLPEVAVATSAGFGIDIDAKEAIAFAVLAYQTWRHRPGNLPLATGARRAVVLGKVTGRDRPLCRKRRDSSQHPRP